MENVLSRKLVNTNLSWKRLIEHWGGVGALRVPEVKGGRMWFKGLLKQPKTINLFLRWSNLNKWNIFVSHPNYILMSILFQGLLGGSIIPFLRRYFSSVQKWFIVNFLFLLYHLRASWCGDLPPGIGAQTWPFDLCQETVMEYLHYKTAIYTTPHKYWNYLRTSTNFF